MDCCLLSWWSACAYLHSQNLWWLDKCKPFYWLDIIVVLDCNKQASSSQYKLLHLLPSIVLTFLFPTAPDNLHHRCSHPSFGGSRTRRQMKITNIEERSKIHRTASQLGDHSQKGFLMPLSHNLPPPFTHQNGTSLSLANKSPNITRKTANICADNLLF